MDKAVPIYIFSGFLGSGKTTLLKRVVDHYVGLGKRPAVIMNELGDVNFDKLLLDDSVPMEELLSGCICCTISGDLGFTVKELVENNELDVIFIEATGAANPIEIFDAVTEASLFQKIDLKGMITVTDSPYILELSKKESNRTVKLMQEQMKCASIIILNKMDLINDQEKNELRALVKDLNKHAEVIEAVKCNVDLDIFKEASFNKERIEVLNHHSHEHSTHSHENHDAHHHSHDHVVVYTHYFDKPIERSKFQEFMSQLPKSILRSKGILQFTDSDKQYLLQYAYYKVDLIEIAPQSKVPNVIVLIGEHMHKEEMRNQLVLL